MMNETNHEINLGENQSPLRHIEPLQRAIK